MKRKIHTDFRTFRALESLSPVEMRDRILGVFGQGDYREYIGNIGKIGRLKGTSITWFPYTNSGKTPYFWTSTMKDGRILVIYDMSPPMGPATNQIGARKTLAGITLDRHGQVLYAADDTDHTIPKEKAQEFLSGYEHLWPALSEYATIRRPGDPSLSETMVMLVRHYAKLGPVLSEYATIRRPGDPSLSETMVMLVGDATDETALTANQIISNAKKWVDDNRKAHPSLMAALRRAYPGEYESVFPDEDLSADMGDLGF